MDFLLFLILVGAVVGGWSLGWFVIGPLISGYMPGTSPAQAAYGTGKRAPWNR